MTAAGDAAAGIGTRSARAVAEAVLYEGYLLYPYRHTSLKNRVRWQFGVLTPPAWAMAQGPPDTSVSGSVESWWQQTECLVERCGTIAVHVRFLQVQQRQVRQRRSDGTLWPVPRVDQGDAAAVGFAEAVPHESVFLVELADVDAGPARFSVTAAAGQDSELVGEAGRAELTRQRWPVSASVEVSAAPGQAPFGLRRLRVRVENTGAAQPASRDEALRHSLVATHLILTTSAGRFLSLMDPPEWAAADAAQCQNVHAFPVLAGDDGAADVLLSAPIILYDHPRVAPESPGDMHDATEIDEILALRMLTLSEQERCEVRETDARAAAILDRVESLPPEVFGRLHGAIRSLAPLRPPAAVAKGAAELGPGSRVRLGPGSRVRLGPGSRVRLRPRRRGTDAHDMFLDGRTARVEEVLHDVDGTEFLAVTVDDDPGRELHQWYGRTRHFRPDEVEPLGEEPVAAQAPVAPEAP